MATIASLLIRLGMDTRDVKRDARDVAPAAEHAGVEAGSKFKAGFRRGMSGFASIVASATKTVVAGATAIAIAAGGIGISTAAGMQQAQIGFSTLLKDGKKAEAFLGELQAFAAKTPFEFPGVRDAARQLLGVGQSAKSVIPTLTAFGDAAGALGLSQEQFERIMLATTQAISKGKFQAEEILQITEAGIPVWPLLSKAMGKPVAVLQKMAEQGKLVAKDVLPKLEAQMRKDYGGSMAKQSQTLTGLWSTLTDTINMGLGNAILPLTPALGRAATAVTALADKGLAHLTEWMETKGAPAVERFTAKVEGMFAGGGAAGLKQTAQEIGDAIRGVFAGVDRGAAGEDLRSMGDSLQKVGPVVRDLVSQLPSFNDLLGVASTVLKFLADHTDELARYLPYVVAGIVAYKIAQAAANLATAAAIPLRVAEVVVNSRMIKANKALAAAVKGQTVATVAGTAAEKTATVATTAGDLAKKRSILSTVGMRAAAVAAAIGTGIWTAAQWALNLALSPVGLIVIGIVIAIGLLVAGILWLWRNNEGFRNFVLGAWAAIKKVIAAVVDWVVGTAWPFLQRTWAKIADLAVGLYHTWRGWLTKVLDFITGLPGRIAAGAKGMFDGLVASAKGSFNKLISIWNAVDFGISIRVPDWVPGVGGKGFSVPDLFPDLPMLAAGGRLTAPGSVVVGEEGPEILDLPRGATVEPLSRGTGPAGGGAPVRVVVQAKDARLAPLMALVADLVQDALDQVAAQTAGGVRF